MSVAPHRLPSLFDVDPELHELERQAMAISAELDLNFVRISVIDSPTMYCLPSTAKEGAAFKINGVLTVRIDGEWHSLKSIRTRLAAVLRAVALQKEQARRERWAWALAVRYLMAQTHERMTDEHRAVYREWWPIAHTHRIFQEFTGIVCRIELASCAVHNILTFEGHPVVHPGLLESAYVQARPVLAEMGLC